MRRLVEWERGAEQGVYERERLRDGETDENVEWERKEGIVQEIQAISMSFAEMYQRLAGYIG